MFAMERERTKEPHRVPNGADNSCVINSDNKCMRNTIPSGSPQHPPSLFRDVQQPTSSPSLPRQQAAKDPLTILHFNDVYNIEGRDREPVGGAARFKTCLDKFSHLNPLTLFSGDALSPSNISVVMKGEQMVPVLNSLDIQCAVYGNHDFDFGVEHLVRLAGEMTFPWLMSNVQSSHTGELLADGKETHIIDWEGRKIGLMGLVEMEWIETLGVLEMKDVIYTDYVTVAKRLASQLKEQGCDLLIALTHMRVPNDVRLAQEVQELHMVLGGHDHHYEKRMVGDVLMLKSGSEFREFSVLTVQFPESIGAGSSMELATNTAASEGRPVIDVKHCKVTQEDTPDEAVTAIVERYLSKVKEGMEAEIGTVACSLEGRFKFVRSRETNLGNLVTDIMRRTMKADVALLNSGTLRSDCLHEAGVFKMKDLLSILPIVDSVMLLELTGAQLLQALENGVSQYPKHEGRFPQVSGLSFTFDPTQPSGHRITDCVLVGGASIEEDKVYKLCTKGYIGKHGKDGYEVFRQCRQLVPEDEGPILFSMVRDHFEACQKSSENHEQVDGITQDEMLINPKVEGRIIKSPPSESSGSE